MPRILGKFSNLIPHLRGNEVKLGKMASQAAPPRPRGQDSAEDLPARTRGRRLANLTPLPFAWRASVPGFKPNNKIFWTGKKTVLHCVRSFLWLKKQGIITENQNERTGVSI